MFLQVKIDDGFPNVICRTCESLLEVFNKFKQICKQTDEILKSRLIDKLKVQVKEVKNEDDDWKHDSCNSSSVPQAQEDQNQSDLETNKVHVLVKGSKQLAIDDKKPILCKLSNTEELKKESFEQVKFSIYYTML